MKHANGNLYQGDFKKGIAHGKIICKYFNGGVYEGDFVDGARHGKGAMTKKSSNGNYVYVGEWKDDVEHGPGTLTEHGPVTLTEAEASGDEYKQEYSRGALLTSKRMAILISGPPSQRARIGEAVGVVVLNEEDIVCPMPRRSLLQYG